MCVIIVSHALLKSKQKSRRLPKIHQGLGVASPPPRINPSHPSTSRHPRRRRERQRDRQTNVTKRRTRRTKRPGTISVVAGVVAASRVARRFVRVIPPGFVRVASPSDPTDTHRERHRRRDRARDVPTNASDTKKNKIIATIASHPHRTPPPARAQSINQITKTHTSVAAARTTVAAARTGRAVVVARVRASASSRRPADVNVADRAAGRAHAAGIVAARRVVVVVAIVGTAVIVVIVVANMVDVLECASLCRPGRVGVPLRKRKRRCPTDRRVLGKMTNCNSRNQPKPNKQKRVPVGGVSRSMDGMWIEKGRRKGTGTRGLGFLDD